MEKRRFSLAQKAAMYIAYDGKCAICGKDLQESWHGDHIVPYSKNGKTDIINAQPLCPECNQRKGSHMPLLASWTKPLREWQNIALEQYQQHKRSDFLLVATPGAGKTTFALRVAHYLLQSEQVHEVIIVCPTANLKEQWANAASVVGIQLDPQISSVSVSLKAGFHGCVTTYQQVALSDTSVELFRYRCRRGVFVIFDEIHHAGEERAWGDGIVQAFGEATYRLGLSGTPFRSDNNPIPFVRYVEGLSKADYSYTYADSLRDGVCRYVFFPKYEGKFEWISGQSGDYKFATFEDELNERLSSERLNTAIHHKGNWISDVIADANRRLTDIRNGEHDNAAGLVIAKDQKHADEVSRLILRLTGIAPTVAVSDDPEASQKISQFSRSRHAWIVAVKMVSEGVDIPRLRIAVYATNVTSELFFRQAVGRIVRHIPGLEEQSAFFYIPDDPTLKAHAFSIKEEREHFIQEDVSNFDDPAYEDEALIDGHMMKIPSAFFPISAEAERDGAIFDQQEYSQEEINRATRYAQQSGIPNPEAVAHLLRIYDSEQGKRPVEARPSTSQSSETPLYKQMEQRRKLLRYLVGKVVSTTGMNYNEVHIRWMRMGGSSQKDASLEELDRKIQWLKGFLEDNHP